jgi:2'-5' RNA ligase
VSEPKQYTTAIIAAVPSKTDPVHEVVAEDAHVTLQFLGEAASLDDAAVEEIKSTLEMLASVVYPFSCSISGTAELGPDKAQVLIIQSELLTKVREMLGLSDAVSTAVASSDQFPNWIPHLTMSYEGEMPDVQAYKTVEIGSLELWLAEEHHVFALDQKTAPVMAAGQKIFEEGLHPRGADGRFIEKFGIIKFLTGSGWAYGKVDGIYHDDASGAVKLTVTPSDLSGNPKGESVVLAPAQVYRAPKAKTHLLTSMTGVKKIGGQGGSNPGGLYEMQVPSAEPNPPTEQYYVKTPKTKSHGNNEALANALYEEAGVPVPEVDLSSDGNLYSKIVTGQQDMSSQLNNPEWTDQVRRNFAVDAWLGNRDVFGMTYDNIITDEHGVPWRIDNGGALLYRAMGAKKTDFGGQVVELDSMRQGKKAKIFGPGMSKAQELDGAERVLAISPAQIEEMVAEHNLPKSLADTLKARRLYIANYYGLKLPESSKPAEAEGPTTAPLVDAPDIAENEGKTRNWFKTSLAQVAMFAEGGDMVELPDGSTHIIGADDDGNPMSIVAQQGQLLEWQVQHGAGAGIYLRKSSAGGASVPRPEHGSMLTGADLTDQRWKRGDIVVDNDGTPWKIKAWNAGTGAMLLQFGSADPILFDTKGKDSGLLFKVERWDPPAVDTLDTSVPTPAVPVMTEQQALDEVQQVQQVEMPNATADFEYQPTTIAAEPFESPDTPELAPPVQGKTGQAAVAEAQIKADLDQPLPTGNGTPAPAKTSAPGGAKVMVIGDGTEASTGDAVTSKKDGKTYTFVKPKGQYAVVTDPNGEDPNKQLLKLASTMTQPGKAPSDSIADYAAPKTATGEVPALGMMALAKDGWAGEITMISPDGKFVFITDANGKRKRKSTGTVSITSAPQGVPEAPKKATGPIKDYGPPPKNVPAAKAALGLPPTAGFALDDLADLDAGDMVIVGYADGTAGLEPYTGQPLEHLLTNTQGKVATYDSISVYTGPASAEQFVAGTAVKGNKRNYAVAWDGTIMLTNGKTGPNGGLLLWDYENPASYAMELPATEQTINILNSAPADTHPAGVLPDWDQVTSYQNNADITYTPPLPLYGDEAMTLGDWKGQGAITKGSKISLDGKNWLEVTTYAPISGNVIVKDINDTETVIPSSSLATFVIKAPQLKDPTDDPAWGAHIADETSADLPGPQPGMKKIGDFVQGDVVTDGEGNISIIDSVTDPDDGTQQVMVKEMGEDWPSPADPNFEFTHHGNITETPVDIPAGIVAPHLYPGATLQFNSTDVPAQVISYPMLQDNGSYKVAVMQDGDPDNLAIVTIGAYDAPGVDISNEAVLAAELGSFTSSQDAGVDPAKLNALWDATITGSTGTDAGVIDKKMEMAEQGVPFGTAQYPIYWNEGSGTFLRQGTIGSKEEWNAETSTWNPIFGSVEGYPKVWDGVPFEGSLPWPEGTAELLPGAKDYKPKPGEVVWYSKLKSTGKGVFVVSQNGSKDPSAIVHTITGPDKLSTQGFPVSELNDPAYVDLAIVHDPFAAPEEISRPIIHHQGPQPPSVLGAKLQTLGYTPSPGNTFWVMQTEVNGAPQAVVLLKQPNGNYKKVSYGGDLMSMEWTPEKLKDYTPVKAEAGAVSPDITHFTWTYQPAGSDGPAIVSGLPAGFQPFEAGDGQSVLKVTLPNGKENVYLQKQPGAGWYEMGQDGTVNEHSDAVKSNHAVQMKLQGKGSQAAKYELLHPLPEGQKAQGQAVPTFENKSGGKWTPEPHQSVVALTSFAGDDDPWYFVQDEPGGNWKPAPNTVDAAGYMDVADVSMQHHLTQKGPGSPGSQYVLAYDGKTGQAAVDTPEKSLPSFSGYTPAEGDKVISFSPAGPGGAGESIYVQQGGTGLYHQVLDGKLSDFVALQPNDVPANLGPEHGNDFHLMWPTEDTSAPETAPGETPTFNGYTPGAGAKVVSMPATGAHYVQVEDGGAWFKVAPTGGLSGVQMDANEMQTLISDPYQITNASTPVPPTYVKKASTGEWHLLTNDGTLSPDTYAQSTVDWAIGEYDINELQGTVKNTGATDTPEDIPAVNPAYAGVTAMTFLDGGGYHFGEFVPSADQLSKLNKLHVLDPGQSVYALADAAGPTTAIVVRNSQGQWSGVLSNGDIAAKSLGGTWGAGGTLANDDESAKQYFQSVGYTIHKLQFGAPTAAAPKAPSGPPAQLSGWAGKGVPDPAGFSHISDPSQGASAKAGDMIFIQGASSGGGGMIAKLAQDWDGSGNFSVAAVLPVGQGGVIDQTAAWIEMDAGSPFKWVDGNNHWISSQPAPAFPGNTPTAAPSAPSPAAPAVPAAPAYPGSQKPSQEDINAWGGALTKDGHIPTAQMFVTGKGPMSGKIVSVSKDKTKAVVLTSDGKKTTRLIEALKVDVSANYSAYAAPVTAKDIPQGMPLAVDTIAEALQKTPADGKFRAILTAHQGVSQGQMMVTKTTAPSGKIYSRVHLTLTPAQREQLVAMLAGQGEKGDWASSSKMSDAVTIGDKLPMRKSSTNNPDGTPRWKVDPSQVPPTHEVTAVADDPSGSGVKIVTMKDVTTGEVITSRFHPGKSLTVYTWDANKPKKIQPGSFAMSDLAKAQGWALVQDGGISAIHGGAENGKLHHEPGSAVSKSALGQVQPKWQTLRNVSADGVVIELVDPKGNDKHSTTGVTVISVPQGVDETALGAAMAKLGIDYSPMTQDSAKGHVRGLLRTLVNLDMSDVDTAKGWSDEKLFSQAGKTMGISDLGWQDVLVGVDESTGKTSFFWSDRARNALAGKAKYNLVYRAASTGTAAQIVSTVKYGSASSILKKTTGMLDGSGSVGNGASASSDNANHAGHGSYASASTVSKLPGSNSFASYKSTGMMIYHRPEAVLGRIMDYRVSTHDAFGAGQGSGADHLAHATSMSSVRDYFLGGGLPTEAVGFIAVADASERTKAIEQLKADGFAVINGRAVEDIIITKQKAATMKPDDLPPVTIPSNARPILDLPTSYDAPAGPVTAAAEEVAA